jgi:23S rRNA pseudouridine1911/1915/1917 synthase
MLQVETHTTTDLQSPMRLSDYAGGKFRLIPSRKGMKKAIDKGWVTVNGAVATTATLLSGGEMIVIQIPLDTKRPQLELPLEVLYEDDFLAVVNKPAGIEVSGNRKRTVENAFPFNLKTSTQEDALPFPEAIHRLDHPTTGVLLIGKTRNAVSRLNELFANGKVNKRYKAVTVGQMPSEGTLDLAIDDKNALTEYRIIESVDSERFTKLNLVDVVLHTGRRHQIRKHFAHIGNPILGDQLYGLDGLILKGKGLYLHACSLSFKHPFTDEQLTVDAPIPKKFNKLFP